MITAGTDDFAKDDVAGDSATEEKLELAGGGVDADDGLEDFDVVDDRELETVFALEEDREILLREDSALEESSSSDDDDVLLDAGGSRGSVAEPPTPESFGGTDELDGVPAPTVPLP